MADSLTDSNLFRAVYRTNCELVRILVIESNNNHWTLTKKAIEKCFTSVATVVVRVASAEKALTLLSKCSVEEWDMPNLILLDPYLPSLEDGLRLLKQIRVMSFPCRRVPVVMLSSSSTQADINRAYSCGISCCCLKPTSFDGWLTLFEDLGEYWLNTASLPPGYYFSS